MSMMESANPKSDYEQKTKWVQKCMNVNHPHYCQMKMQAELRNSATYLKSMAAGIVADAKEEEQYQKRKVKDDVCKDCDKIHSFLDCDKIQTVDLRNKKH
jgi:hypothetical protein